MRILILGKNGLLGHDLLQVFHQEDVIAFGSKDLDITQQDDVFEQFMTIQPDLVINATGYTNVDLAQQQEEKAKSVNGYAVGILAKASREVGATFVHFSTDYVFDGTKKEGYSEEDSTHPVNAYGRSKELGEKLLVEEMEMQVSEKDPEGHYFIIRTSWLYGSNGKNFVDTMLNLAKNRLEEWYKGGLPGKPQLMVVNDQHGKPTYSLDLARQVRWLVESHEYPSGIYHITNEGETTWYDFAKKIFDLSNLGVDVLPCSSSQYPRPAKRPSYSSLINNKLPLLRSWEEALNEYLLIKN